MSWSFQAIGSPEKVVEALEAHGDKISRDPADSSRAEYEEARPHLVALVKQNFARDGVGYSKPAIKLTASGSAATERTGEGNARQKVQSQVQVTLETLWGFVG